MSKKIQWKGGPPPHIGWWNASVKEDTELWRWWNGRYWSMAVNPNTPISVVAYRAKLRSVVNGRILWNDSYPKTPEYRGLHHDTRAQDQAADFCSEVHQW